MLRIIKRREKETELQHQFRVMARIEDLLSLFDVTTKKRMLLFMAGKELTMKDPRAGKFIVDHDADGQEIYE